MSRSRYPSRISMGQKASIDWPLAFFLCSLLFNILAILYFAPSILVYDEGSYAIMVNELSRDPSSVIPTITGEAAEYKPPLFTWAVLPFYEIMKGLPLPVETILRLPSALFGALSTLFLYRIALKLYGKDTALVSALLFMSSPAIIFSSSLVMMESFSIFLILASIHFYISGKPHAGALFLGFLAMTKWLYIVAPVIFLALYFLKKPELPKVLMSFLSIPLFIISYLAISFHFGSIDNALDTLLFDIIRSQPSISSTFIMANIVILVWYLFPISAFFLYLLATNRSDILREKHLIAMALVVSLAVLSNKFLPWYGSISFPAMIIFVSIHLAKSGKLLPFLVVMMVSLNLFALGSFPLTEKNPETRDLAEFTKGKNATFFETKVFYTCWEGINERYRGTDKSYLLLEQRHAGFLFYRFNDTQDYGNLSAVYKSFNETPGCGDYLIVDSDEPVPGCYHTLWNTSRYWVYSTKE